MFVNATKYFALYPFPRFTTLDLAGKQFNFFEFKQCGFLSNVSYLNLARVGIGQQFDGFNWMYQLGQITFLDLSYNRLGDQGMFTFSKARFLSEVVHLNLSGNNITHRGMEHFSACDFLKEVRLFIFLDNPIGPLGMHHFSNCPFLAQI